MNYRLMQIIELLSEDEYKTSAVIGRLIGVSEKTIRSRIKEINDIIKEHGAEIYSKPRYGYFLKIEDKKMWDDFLNNKEKRTRVPADATERKEYLLFTFLNTSDYVKLEELSEFLYVSQKTLSNELKNVEFVLSHFDIKLERKPYYGIRAVGQEFNKRKCILQYFVSALHNIYGINLEEEENTNGIAKQLLEFTGKHNIRFSETAFHNTVLYINLSISRIKAGMIIADEDKVSYVDEYKHEINLAREIYENIEQKLGVVIPEAEIMYTAIYIAGKRFINGDENFQPNFIIPEDIDKLVSKILESIYEAYKIDLRNDFNLRIALNYHLMPMKIRLQYGIDIDDSVLEQVSEKHFFAFTMAQLAAEIISNEYGKVVSDNETACIAMYLALSMEEKKTTVKRKRRILLVCVSGKASSKMLMYRFRQEFGEYIESLQVCGMYDFEQYDLKNIDLIFSTVVIYKKVDVPIMQINDFLDSYEILAVRQALQLGDLQFIQHFYKQKYFFPDIAADNKEDVIREMCNRINDITPLPDDFYDSVLQREKYGATDLAITLQYHIHVR